MSTQDQRIKKIEQRLVTSEGDSEPLFVEWECNPWMPEEEADVLARHPDCDYFQKTIMPYARTYPAERKDGPILRTLNGTEYFARKQTPEMRMRLLKCHRTRDLEEEEHRQKQIQRLRDYMHESQGLPPRPDKEYEPPQFVESPGNPWTDEEKVDVLAKHPECDWFNKADPSCREYTGMDSTFQTLDGSLYRAEKKVPWVCY